VTTPARRRTLSQLFTWRSAIADSTLPPTSRHVALTLSLHMSERGDSCFPSLNTLARETGLSKSTIAKHLAELEKRCWIDRQPGGCIDGKNVPTRYTALIPEGVRLPDYPSPSDAPPGVRVPDGGSPGAGHEVVIESDIEGATGSHSCFIDSCGEPVTGMYAGQWWCTRHLEEHRP
jgi:hypothetical protein